ncbi:hypothetical protein BASA62_001689 [Batrachochytrium salamandrivorans]|nr:hypothetical protein BASA62_001689 [Batrachochytrium salamandrivorans]
MQTKSKKEKPMASVSPAVAKATIASAAASSRKIKGRFISIKAQERRPIFKHVLGTPFVTNWSSPDNAEQQAILTEFCACTASVGIYRRLAIRERKLKSRKVKQAMGELDADTSVNEAVKISSDEVAAVPLQPLTDLVIGINNVTKILEDMISHKAKTDALERDRIAHEKCNTNSLKKCDSHVVDPIPTPSQPLVHKTLKPPPQLRCIFVCRGDMPVGHLYSHLPAMAAIIGGDLRICAFSAGAEKTLSLALGIKHVSTLGIKISTPRFDRVFQLVVQSDCRVNIPWLHNPMAASYLPTKVRAIKTVGPIKNKNTRVGSVSKKAKIQPDAPAIDGVRTPLEAGVTGAKISKKAKTLKRPAEIADSNLPSVESIASGSSVAGEYELPQAGGSLKRPKVDISA